MISMELLLPPRLFGQLRSAEMSLLWLQRNVARGCVRSHVTILPLRSFRRSIQGACNPEVPTPIDIVIRSVGRR
jgi:hypothetical protein